MGDGFVLPFSRPRFFCACLSSGPSHNPAAMKLKQSPDDFHAEELTDLVLAGEGAFAFYRLEKRGWSTPDALAAVRRRWKVEPRRLSYGGLKDRHAATVQYFSVFHGPRRRLTHHDVR